MNLDLALRQAKCLTLAVAGTNGKSTVASLIERMLVHNDRRTVVCGREAKTLGSVLGQTAELDYLVLQLECFELQRTSFLRPAVAVLLNVDSDHLDHFGNAEAYIRSFSSLFLHQQFFDWAIIQSQALKELRRLGIPVPAKTISFSATDPGADLSLSRGLLVSRLLNWSGPLLDLDHCLLRGPHNAENVLAALAVGHVLRLPLEGMLDALKTCRAGQNRCELVAELNGIQFINDAKASNPAAMESALHACRPGPNGAPNVWLIAGGCDSEANFHASGPLISRRVKGAFLIGEASQKIRSAWGLFTPCMLVGSLLEAVAEAARKAASGDVILLSPACSGLDQFENYQHRGQVFCAAVKSIGRGHWAPRPHMFGVTAPAWS